VTPSVGADVHYVSHTGPKCRAAKITELPDGAAEPQTVSLFVMEPATTAFVGESSRYDGLPHRGGTWHWPEQVPREPGDRPPRF
jgi:hypothetical protein